MIVSSHTRLLTIYSRLSSEYHIIRARRMEQARLYSFRFYSRTDGLILTGWPTFAGAILIDDRWSRGLLPVSRFCLLTKHVTMNWADCQPLSRPIPRRVGSGRPETEFGLNPAHFRWGCSISLSRRMTYKWVKSQLDDGNSWRGNWFRAKPIMTLPSNVDRADRSRVRTLLTSVSIVYRAS